ncbi:hypothetical protein EMMF5_002852 [Cystobasidiomycetes sp. EMM_F5]
MVTAGPSRPFQPSIGGANSTSGLFNFVNIQTGDSRYSYLNDLAIIGLTQTAATNLLRYDAYYLVTAGPGNTANSTGNGTSTQ